MNEVPSLWPEESVTSVRFDGNRVAFLVKRASPLSLHATSRSLLYVCFNGEMEEGFSFAIAIR